MYVSETDFCIDSFRFALEVMLQDLVRSSSSRGSEVGGRYRISERIPLASDLGRIPRRSEIVATLDEAASSWDQAMDSGERVPLNDFPISKAITTGNFVRKSVVRCDGNQEVESSKTRVPCNIVSHTQVELKT